jgi:predicted DNA-binding ribbon-helix-helix protein
MIDERLSSWPAEREDAPNLTSAVRVFIAAYFRRAATEDGHGAAGHGRGNPLAGTPFEHV